MIRSPHQTAQIDDITLERHRGATGEEGAGEGRERGGLSMTSPSLECSAVASQRAIQARVRPICPK